VAPLSAIQQSSTPNVSSYTTPFLTPGRYSFLRWWNLSDWFLLLFDHNNSFPQITSLFKIAYIDLFDLNFLMMNLRMNYRLEIRMRRVNHGWHLCFVEFTFNLKYWLDVL